MKQGLDLQRVQFQQFDEPSDFTVITWRPELYSNQRFLQSALDLQKKLTFISPEQIQSPLPKTTYLLRLGSYRFIESLEKLKACQLQCSNPLNLFELYRDKIKTLQVWKEHLIPFPKSLILETSSRRIFDLDHKTVFSAPTTTTPESLFKALCQCLALPHKDAEKEFLLKFPLAIKGQGVYLVQSPSDLQKVLETNLQSDVIAPEILIQKYYPECQGEDFRVLQIKEESFAIRRKNLNDFKSNLSQGGTAFPCDLSLNEKFLCSKVFKLSNLNYAGIDFIKTLEGVKFLEINVSPGFEGIEKALNIDVATKILNASF